jgi:glutathione S-transferase
MQLFDNPASPYCRKVMVVLHETGQLGDVTLIPASGHPTDPGTMPVANNPLGKVPTLLRDSGPAMYDSRVICRFFDARKSAGLYPEARLWDTLTLEATGDGILDAAILMVYESRSRPENARSPEWLEGQWAKIARALDMLEARWMSHLHGHLDMGQIAIGCALGSLDFRHDARNWRQGRDALAAWEKTFATRESMAATIPHAP